MGGGGHLSNAATQLSDITIEDAIRQLIQVIEEIGSEINSIIRRKKHESDFLKRCKRQR